MWETAFIILISLATGVLVGVGIGWEIRDKQAERQAQAADELEKWEA
jgi:F0F1-type ATP synthase assembly protein I